MDSENKFSLKFLEVLKSFFSQRFLNISLKQLDGVAKFINFFILVALVSTLNVDIGYSININNKSFGTVATRKQAEELIDNSMKRLSAVKGGEFLFNNAGYSVTISKKTDIISSSDMENKIICALDGLTNAYGVYADGKLIAAASDEKNVQNALNEIKNKYKASDCDVSFYNNVLIKPVRVKKSSLLCEKDLSEALNKNKEQAVIHEVAEGETIDSIAEKYKITSQEILKNNPKVIPEVLKVGTELCITAPVALIQVKSISHETINEKIMYSTKVKKDSTRYQGDTAVISEGVCGEKNVEYEIVKINDVVLQKKPVGEKIIKNASDKIILSGTKPKPKEAPTGKFLRPYYGSISSRFGRRWGRQHSGVDFSGNVGDAVKAADGGSVSYAGWMSGYGNIIIIQHNTGYESYYGHLSKIGVSVGQKVAQGAVIGKLGNTGNSTGPHLHFEIRKNGVAQDPLGYTG